MSGEEEARRESEIHRKKRESEEEEIRLEIGKIKRDEREMLEEQSDRKEKEEGKQGARKFGRTGGASGKKDR